MQNTRLIQLLKSLSTSEIKQFKDFISSPVFNKNKNVISLFESLKKYHPDFINIPNEEDIFKKVFPGTTYDYFKLKNIVSDLLALGKEFLIFIKCKANDRIRQKFLLEQLRDRSLDNLFLQSHKSFTNELHGTIVTDENYFLHSFRLWEELLWFYSPKEPNTHLEMLQFQFDNFLRYSLIKLLKFYNTMLHEKLQNNFEYDFKMMDEVIEYLRNSKAEDNPTMLIYYYIILLLKEKDDRYFFELKKLLSKHFNELNAGDKYMLFLHMAGHCAYNYNILGKRDFMREHFWLSKENFERGSIELGKLLYLDFLNHVKIAIRVDEFEWAEKYMNTFKDKLTEEKESTLNFCYGFINYKKGNLDEALELFSKANFPNYIIKLQVKILLLQIYFEKEFYDQALAMIDSFRHYLTREKSIIDEFKQVFFEYLKTVNDLIRYKLSVPEKNNNYEFKKLTQQVSSLSGNQFGIKMWLCDMIAKLEPGPSSNLKQR